MESSTEVDSEVDAAVIDADVALLKVNRAPGDLGSAHTAIKAEGLNRRIG